MPGPRNQKKPSKRKSAAPDAVIASPKNGSMSTASESTPACNFRSFLEMADGKTIAQFCNWASTTSDGENLRLLWVRTMEEGEKLGIMQGKKLGLKEGIERGMDLGREEGYLVAKEGFNKIIRGIKARGTPKKTTTHETAMQTNNDL